MQTMDLISPLQLQNADGNVFLEQYRWRFLAEGDSWFSIGTLNPLKNSSLLHELALEQRCCAINCAVPGDTLSHMVDLVADPLFVDLLAGAQARTWDGLLISAGGNDLIDAAGVSPSVADPALRLLLRSDEWGPLAAGAGRYLSDAGWATFARYLKANFDELVALRDRGPSAGCPLFIHGYAVPVPRPAGAGAGFGPWLLPSLKAYAIPPVDHAAVAVELLRRFGELLRSIESDAQRYPNVHFFDSAALPLLAADAASASASGDWINEIHLSRDGYRKLGPAWGTALSSVMAH